MKNEELFDMLTEIKVDDEYVDEALTGGSDSRGIKVYAGKTRVTPMKIVAPIAACLAVFAAAGLIFVNRDKLPIKSDSGMGAASTSEVVGNSSAENSDVESTESTPSDSEIKPVTSPDIVPIWQDSVFYHHCVDFIQDKYADLLQGGITWWKQGMIDIDFDGEDEYLLCPQVNYETVKGVDVCVFRRVGIYSDMEYLGSLDGDFTEMYFDDIYFATDDDNKCYYYYDCVEEYEKCTDTIQKIYFDKEKNAVREQPYLQLVKTYPNDASSYTPYTQTAYRYGEEITAEQLLEEWGGIQNSAHKWEILPTPNLFDAHKGTDEYVQILVDKYGLSMNANALHRVVQSLDIDRDGEDETVIEFRNCEQLKGVYVFSPDGRLIGEFDPNGYRGCDTVIVGGMSTSRDEYLFLCNENGESYYFYEATHSGHDGKNIWLEEEIYKIIVNADGTLNTVAVLEASYNPSDEYFRIYGKNVSREEYWQEGNKYTSHFSPNVSSDPFVW